jgi:hypothetical protein
MDTQKSIKIISEKNYCWDNFQLYPFLQKKPLGHFVKAQAVNYE